MFESTATVNWYTKQMKLAVRNIDYLELERSQDEALHQMLSFLEKTDWFFKHLLTALKTKKQAKSAFRSKVILNELTRKKIRFRMTKHYRRFDDSQKAILVRYLRLLQPKVHYILSSFEKLHKKAESDHNLTYGVWLPEFEKIKQKYKKDIIDQLCNSCLPLVVRIAKETKSDLSMEERICYGNAGLLRAARRFDAKKGFKFSTYAKHWIKQSIYMGIDEQMYLIKPTSNAKAEYLKYSTSKNTDDKFDDILLQTAYNSSKVPGFADIINNDAHNETATEYDPASSYNLEHDIDKLSWLRDGKKLFKETLTEEQFHVITRHFGLFDNDRVPITKISEETGKSHFILTKILDSGLKRLKSTGAVNMLEGFLG